MIQYPTHKEVLAADRKQVYRWFLFLRIPGFSKWNKKSGTFTRDPSVPEDAQEILKLIDDRWVELGGRDLKIAKEIMMEVINDAPAGPDTARSKNNVEPTS